MPITVRELQGDEIFDVLYRLPFYAFRSSPPMGDPLERQESLARRSGSHFVAVFENNEAVACAESAPLTQNVRQALLPMAGILDVTTSPQARYKGYAKRALAHLFTILHGDGRAVSCLYPFRESFYERLGYVVLPQPRKAIFAPSALAPLLRKDLGGSVEHMLLAEGYDIYRDFILRLRRRVHGIAEFEYDDWLGPRKQDLWLALARVGGEVEGLMLYDLKGERITQFTMGVRRFFYLSSQAKYLLLSWIARHIDQANRVEITLSPAEHPETWVDDLQITLEGAFITPMARVFDVARIAGMSSGPGRVAIGITDPVCPWNEGVWQLETVDGRLVVRRGGEPDGALGIQALSALAYGTYDPGDFALRGWGAPSAALQQTLHAMFPPMAPYLHEAF